MVDLIYNIKDENGNVVNTIVATEEFVTKHYDYYELVEEYKPSEEDLARDWRDSELERTDILAVLPDYPEKTALLEYRQVLRDWTDTEEFPETRPVMGG